MGKAKQLQNKQFNRWVVLNKEGANKRGELLWKCKCICGNIGYLTSRQLTSGVSKSCGCLKHDMLLARNKNMATHHLSKTRLYSIWDKMRVRCYSVSCSDYKDYGARGIKVCDEWRNDFLAFKKWAELNGYKDNLSIDRKDVNGNYEPINCRWATIKEQANNKRSNRYITLNGKTKTLSEWSEIIGVDRKTLDYRIKHNWETDDLCLPPYKKRRNIAI